MINKYKINWKTFKNLWNQNANYYDFYNQLKLERYVTFKQWDHNWQFRTVLNDNYKQAKSELLDCLLGA